MNGRTFDPAEFRVDPDPARAEGLPARAFTDPEFLALEIERIFDRMWSIVPEPAPFAPALRTALAPRGARYPFELLGRPLFLQRDWNGRLRAFPNVCTHAWHTLVAGPGRDRYVVCPQHGRQFGCDGRFRLQPGFVGRPGFPGPADHLRPLAAGAIGPHLAVCPGGRPLVGLGTLLRDMTATTRRLAPESWTRADSGAERREVEGNWKLHVQNYLDRFHIAFVHRAPGGLADAVDLSSYRTEIHPWSVLQWVHAAHPADGFEPDALPARLRDPARPARRVFALWWLLFPALALNFYPWGLSVNAWLPVPGRPERTLFLWTHWVRDPRRYRERNRRWLLRQVDDEDVATLAEVARGVRSGFAPRSRFAPAEEAGPHWLHRRIYELVFEAERPARPVRKAAATWRAIRGFSRSRRIE